MSTTRKTLFTKNPHQRYSLRLACVAFDHYRKISGPTGAVTIEGVSYARPLNLYKKLRKDPKFQYKLAIETHYVPSKWLLEQEMAASRRWHDKPEKPKDVYAAAASSRLVGVCFSGGGIRSATFNLGIVQGLAQLGLLKWVDYLSSVSGGGYIHEFLAAWILREKGGMAAVTEKLIPQAEPGCPPRSPDQIRWLLKYASYLTPKRGIFSGDTWTLVAIWMRNTTLNQIPILAGLACCFFLVDCVVEVPIYGKEQFTGLNRSLVDGIPYRLLSSGVLVGGLTVWSLVALGINLVRQTRRAHPKPEDEDKKAPRLLTNAGVQSKIILPWLACAIWMTLWAQVRFDDNNAWAYLVPGIGGAMLLTLAWLVTFAGDSLGAYARLFGKEGDPKPSKPWGIFLLPGLFSSAVATGIGYVFMQGSNDVAGAISKAIGVIGKRAGADPAPLTIAAKGSYSLLLEYSAQATDAAGNVAAAFGGPTWIDPWRIQVVLLPALLLFVPFIAIELTLGLLGREFPDARREWLARMRAWSLLYAALWTGLVGVVVLSPYLVDYIASKGWVVSYSTVVTFMAAHGVTIFAGSSKKADGKPTDKGILGYKPADLAALVASPIAVLGILIGLSFSISWLVEKTAIWLQGQFGMDQGRYWVAHGICIIASAIVALVFGWRVDINEFSMQSFYRNRLSRCYLGGTIAHRRADPFTGFDDRQKLKLDNPRACVLPAAVTDLLPDRFNLGNRLPGRYDGPFPIFCATLNLTTGEDLASQERKGASFAFTPMYSGYSVSWTDAPANGQVSLNGYVPTEQYAYRGKGIHLDTAVAVSGAALNPNQGYNSNPALAFLMAFFNVRLGWWISNPRMIKRWRAEGNRPTPTVALWYLFKELLGSVNDASNYVNLSDGGHFENMGLYELVRRRCTYIIVSDAEADPEMKFEGMGSAITKCRADFGVEIDLDLRPLQIQKDGGYSKAHCVVGTIRYPPPPGENRISDEGASMACECLGEKGTDKYTGVIVYIKSSLAGDEPADLLAYKLRHDVFPHDMTGDQWFAETQFESYRRLGHHVAMTAIQPALPPMENKISRRNQIEKLFGRMYAIWYPPTPEMDKHQGDHLKQYESILSELRVRPELAGLAEKLNDERTWKEADEVDWIAPPNPTSSREYALQFANSLLDFMYTVYENLNLAFPDNRVSPRAEWWVCLFRRWCRVTLIRDTWKGHVAMHSPEFRLFARRELKLPKGEPWVE
jgi:hypothetical protein